MTSLHTIPAEQPTDGLVFKSVKFHKTTVEITDADGSVSTVEFIHEGRRLVLGEIEYRIGAKTTTDMCLSRMLTDYRLEIFLTIQ